MLGNGLTNFGLLFRSGVKWGVASLLRVVCRRSGLLTWLVSGGNLVGLVILEDMGLVEPDRTADAAGPTVQSCSQNQQGESLRHEVSRKLVAEYILEDLKFSSNDFAVESGANTCSKRVDSILNSFELIFEVIDCGLNVRKRADSSCQRSFHCVIVILWHG